MGISGTMAKAAKLSEKANLDNFFPKVAKLAREGKNTVSAERALAGDRMISKAYKGAVGSGSAADELSTRALTARGPAGGKAARDEITRVALKGKPSERELAYDTLVRRADENAIHRADALRDERSALIQFNGGGYSNPALKKVQPGMSLPTVGNFSGGRQPHNQTFGYSAPTGAAALLAKRM